MSECIDAERRIESLVTKWFGRFLIFGLYILTLNGCAATMVFERYHTVEIRTEPAGASIYDHEGFNIGVTPLEIPLKRNKVQHLTLRKGGYTDRDIVMSRSINRWAFPLYLPVLFTESPGEGLIWLVGSDVIGGGIFKKGSNYYNFALEPAGSIVSDRRKKDHP